MSRFEMSVLQVLLYTGVHMYICMCIEISLCVDNVPCSFQCLQEERLLQDTKHLLGLSFSRVMKLEGLKMEEHLQLKYAGLR